MQYPVDVLEITDIKNVLSVALKTFYRSVRSRTSVGYCMHVTVIPVTSHCYSSDLVTDMSNGIATNIVTSHKSVGAVREPLV